MTCAGLHRKTNRQPFGSCYISGRTVLQFADQFPNSKIWYRQLSNNCSIFLSRNRSMSEQCNHPFRIRITLSILGHVLLSFHESKSAPKKMTGEDGRGRWTGRYQLEGMIRDTYGRGQIFMGRQTDVKTEVWGHRWMRDIQWREYWYCTDTCQ